MIEAVAHRRPVAKLSPFWATNAPSKNPRRPSRRPTPYRPRSAARAAPGRAARPLPAGRKPIWSSGLDLRGAHPPAPDLHRRPTGRHAFHAGFPASETGPAPGDIAGRLSWPSRSQSVAYIGKGRSESGVSLDAPVSVIGIPGGTCPPSLEPVPLTKAVLMSLMIPWYVAALGAAVVWGIHYPLIQFAISRYVSLLTVLLLTVLPMLLLGAVLRARPSRPMHAASPDSVPASAWNGLGVLPPSLLATRTRSSSPSMGRTRPWLD